ncbi:ribosomal protein, partial [Oryctes borbonicus]
MQSSRILYKTSLNQWRSIYRCSTLYQSTTTNVAVDNLTIPPPSNVDNPTSPKIQKLVSEISQLNLIEVSELTTLLKKQLNLPDAPILPVGNFSASAQAAQEEEDVAPVKVKTQFTVKLTKYDEKQKVALIKEIKNLLEGMNLVQAKKFVESAPTVVKADIAKEEAE